MVKPFMQYPGGKRQLLNVLDNLLPANYKKDGFSKYFEPMIGGGALLFHILSNYHVDEVYISDINKELILIWNVIKDNPEELIYHLNGLEKYYLSLDSFEERKDFYLDVRSDFNIPKFDDNILRAAQSLFLNKTCFNGLFRFNKKGEFNTPFGTGNDKLICNSENIMKVSNALSNTIIKQDNYKCFDKYIDADSFVYLDPPYKPLSKTSNFAYNNIFGDNEQIELSQYYNKLSERNVKCLLSNSYPDDGFFDKLYSKHEILQVDAKRSINCKADGRGNIKEIIVKNYKED